MMADVNLFGGRGGAARGGVVGRPARGGVSNRVPQTDRQRLVEAGEDYLHLTNQLGMNYSTARNIIRVWLRDGRVETRRQGAHTMLLSLVPWMKLFEKPLFALAAPFTTLTSMKQQLLQRFSGIPISLSTVTRHLDDHDISTKIAGKDVDIPFESNHPAIVERRRQCGQWLASLNINHRLIYVDESGYNVFTRHMIGRAPVGERVRREVAP